MVDVCIHIAIVEELSIFCWWVENGPPVEHFVGILPLKKTNAEYIYSTLIDCLKKKNVQCRKLIGMRFNGTATFAREKSEIQARLGKNTPHAIFIYCHYHRLQMLQMAIVQAANSTQGINHVYTYHFGSSSIFCTFLRLSQLFGERQKNFHRVENCKTF